MPHQRRGAVGVVALVCVLISSSLGCLSTVSAARQTVALTPQLVQGVAPELHETALAATPLATIYEMTIELDTRAHIVKGNATIAFVNDSLAPLREIHLLLPPNDPEYYGDTSLVILEARFDGQLVRPITPRVSPLAVYPLTTMLPPGGRLMIDLAFTTTLTDDPESPAYPAYWEPTGSWLLLDWYPRLAPMDTLLGWQSFESPYVTGRVTDRRDYYDVTVWVDSGLSVVATGTEVRTHPLTNNRVSRQIIAGPIDAFVLIADGNFARESTRVGETRVTVWTEPDGTDTAQAALEYAAEALAYYTATFGPFPYQELDLIQHEVLFLGGVAFGGLIIFSPPTDDSGLIFPARLGAADLIMFESLIAHEIGHQWWGYVLVTDYHANAFLFEGITEFIATRYMGDKHGSAVLLELLDVHVWNYQGTSPSARTEPPHRGRRPVMPDAAWLGALYGRAPLGFLAISLRIGDDAFDHGLRQVIATHTFRTVSPVHVRRAFEDTAEMDLGDVWFTWFDAPTDALPAALTVINLVTERAAARYSSNRAATAA